MDLPIFQENLRSSAGWLNELERSGKLWKDASVDQHVRARALQVEHATKRFDSMGLQLSPSFSEAVDLISVWAAAPATVLDLARLTHLYEVLAGVGSGQSPLRTEESQKLNEYHDPAPASIVPRLIENAVDWFQTESFGQIHPVEQAAIAHLRVLDLQPFASANEEIAELVASFYVERAGYPPLVLFSDSETIFRYEAVREAAFRMLTQHLVEFIAESLTRTIKTSLV